MTYYSVSKPYEVFYDNSGDPLENGYIYIGEVNQNPITNPITVYWDVNGLYPAAQPIRTLAGYPSRNGSPSRIFIDSADNLSYSILIQDKNGELVYSSIDAISDGYAAAGNVDSISDLRVVTGFNNPIYIRGHTVIGKGSGVFEYKSGAAPGTYVDDNGNIIVPAGGDGSSAWIRQLVDGMHHTEDFGVIGDGITDDTTAMQAALDSIGQDSSGPDIAVILDEGAPGLFIDVPENYVLITDELTFSNSAFICGAGQSSVIRFAPTQANKHFLTPEGPNNVSVLRDFSIMGPGQTADEASDIGVVDGTQGLYITDTSFGLFQNLYVSNFPESIGIHLTGGIFRCHFKDNHFNNCATAYKLGDKASSSAINSNSIKGGSIRACGSKSTVVLTGSDADKYDFLQEHAGIVLGAVKQLDIANITFESNYGTCILMQKARNIKVSTCWMEANCRLLDSSNAYAVASANDESLTNIWLNAADAGTVWVVGTDIAIDNIIIENCRDEYKPRLQASDSRWIHSFYYKNNYVTARPPSITVIDGYSFDLFLEGCTRRDSGLQQINPSSNYRPEILSVTTTGTYPDDPFLVGRYGERIATGYRVTQAPTLAGTDDIIIDSSIGYHENECIIQIPTSYSKDNAFDRLKYITNGYIPAGYTVTLQFANGTHTWTSSMDLQEFNGGGILRFMGNQSEGDSLHTNQAVTIVGTAISDAPHITINNSNISVHIEKIKFSLGSDNNHMPIKPINIQGQIYMNACYVISNGTRDGYGIWTEYCQNVLIENNYFNNLSVGVNAQRTSSILSNNNDDTGTTPSYGLRAQSAVIMKQGTQPTGNTANELTANGGVIR
jgi:hypothetical protein